MQIQVYAGLGANYMAFETKREWEIGPTCPDGNLCPAGFHVPVYIRRAPPERHRNVKGI
jgi:hypothetical protein